MLTEGGGGTKSNRSAGKMHDFHLWKKDTSFHGKKTALHGESKPNWSGASRANRSLARKTRWSSVFARPSPSNKHASTTREGGIQGGKLREKEEGNALIVLEVNVWCIENRGEGLGGLRLAENHRQVRERRGRNSIRREKGELVNSSGKFQKKGGRLRCIPLITG